MITEHRKNLVQTFRDMHAAASKRFKEDDHDAITAYMKKTLEEACDLEDENYSHERVLIDGLMNIIEYSNDSGVKERAQEAMLKYQRRIAK